LPILAALDRSGTPDEDPWLAVEPTSVGDAVVADVALFDVRLTVPKAAEVATSGSLVSSWPNGDAQKTWRFVTGPSREFAAVVRDPSAGLPARLDAQAAEHRLHYYPSAPEGRTSAHETLAQAKAAFDVYERRFGPYPDRELDLIETDITLGGYEFPGLVMLDEGTRRSGPPAASRFLTAHEVAHQWFYSLVGSSSTAEPWLDEALATFAVAVYLGDAVSPAAADQLVESWRQEFRYPPSVPLDQPAANYRSWSDYRGPVYYQGALFLVEARRSMGDRAFFTSMRRYVDRHRHGVATTAALLGALQAGGLEAAVVQGGLFVAEPALAQTDP
jgi:aminopeptidase N